MFSARAGFEYAGGTDVSKIYWYGAIDLKQNGNSSQHAVTNGSIKIINGAPYVFGYGDANAQSRAYIAKIDDYQGVITQYIVWPDGNSTTTDWVVDIAIDTNGYVHVIFSSGAVLERYTSSFVLSQAIILSSAVGDSRKIVADNAGYIYVLTDNSYIVKLNGSNYSVVWSMSYTFPAPSIQQSEFKIDSNNNLFILENNKLIKINSSNGAIIWQKVFSYINSAQPSTMCFDGSNNIYVCQSDTLLQINNSTGAKNYEYFVIFTNQININNLCINGDNNLVIGGEGGSGYNAGVTVLGNITGTPNVLFSTSYFDSQQWSAGTYNSFNNTVTNGTNIYLSIGGPNNSANTRSVTSLLKLPISGNLVGLNNAYSYTVTSDNGSNISFSGNITSANSSPYPYISSSSNVTINTTSYTNTVASITTSNTTQSTTTIVPFSYGLSI